MRRPFGLTFPIHTGMVRFYPLHIQLPAIGTVAVAVLAVGTVAAVLGRGIAGLDDMESAELHKHRESAEDQLVVYLQTLAAAFRSCLRSFLCPSASEQTWGRFLKLDPLGLAWLLTAF